MASKLEEDPLLTPEQVAHYLGVTRSRVIRWFRHQVEPDTWVGPKMPRWWTSTVLKAIEEMSETKEPKRPRRKLRPPKDWNGPSEDGRRLAKAQKAKTKPKKPRP
jgi:hypothetical protein